MQPVLAVLGSLFLPLFPASFESQFGDARFVEFTEAELHHFVELLFGGGRQRKIQLLLFGQSQCYAGILGGVSGGEKAGVIPVFHILAVGCEHAGIRSGLGKHFHYHVEVELQRTGESETFRESGGVDVHDHVNERLDLGRFAGGTNVTEQFSLIAQFDENVLHLVKRGGRAGAHQVERAVSSLRDARRHTGFERFGLRLLCELADLHMHGRRNGCAINENASFCAVEQTVALGRKDFPHGFVVRDHGENDIRQFGDAGQSGAGFRSRFAGQRLCEFCVEIVNGGDGVATFLEPASHVGAHATESDKSNFCSHDVFGVSGGLAVSTVLKTKF